MLAEGGLVSIVAYPGHAQGFEEHERVRELLGALPQREFSVGCWLMVNKKNDPPLFYLVEKVKGV